MAEDRPARAVRCFHRQSVLAFYTPHSAAITVRLNTAEIASEEAITHELVHHDLTEETLAGMLDQLLGRGAADPELASADRECLQTALERAMAASAVVHEATATYIAALGERVVGRAPIPLGDLPPAYRQAVGLILGIPLDDPYGPSEVSFLGNASLAIACAHAALDSPHIVQLLRGRPSRAEELYEMLSVDADPLFIRLTAELQSSLQPIQNALTLFCERRLGIADPRTLDRWATEHDLAEIQPDLTDALALHETFPDLLGAHLPPPEKAQLWAEFVRHCQRSIFDSLGRAYFMDVAVTGTLGDRARPDFDYLFPSIRMEKIWRLVRSPPVRPAGEAVAWFETLAAVAAPRGLRVVVHGRELFNEREMEVKLTSGESVPPRAGVMHFDLQLDRTKADGSEIVDEDIAAVSAIAQSVSIWWRTQTDERTIYRALDELALPVVWHAGWLSAFGAARRPDAYRSRPGRSVFYLDQSGATGRLFDQILDQLTIQQQHDVIRANLFDGASDAYVVQNGTHAWCAVFPNSAMNRRLEAFETAHPGRVRQFLENGDWAAIDPLIRYGMYYVYNLVKET
jgi:hypothetical protein